MEGYDEEEKRHLFHCLLRLEPGAVPGTCDGYGGDGAGEDEAADILLLGHVWMRLEEG